MDEVGRKDAPSLPPDYVSLAQLQERWVQKQQEKMLRKKEEEEKKERDARTRNENQNLRGLKNDGLEKMAGLSLRDVPQRRIKKDGREMDAIDGKGKGKEKINGGLEDGEKKKKKKKKKKFAAYGEKEKPRSESGDVCEGVEIVPRDEVKVGTQGVLSGASSGAVGVSGGLKGINERGSASMVEASPRCGVRREISEVKRMDSGSGFRRNGVKQGSRYKSKTDYRDRVNESKDTLVKLTLEKKMEDEKGYGKNWRNGDFQERCRLKEIRIDVLKSKEVESESEKKAENESFEVCSEIGGWNGGYKNGFWRNSNKGRNNTKEHRVEGEGLDDNKMALEKKVDNEVLAVESAKSGEKERLANEYRRYGNWTGNIGRKFGGLAFTDWEAGNVRSRVEMNVGVRRKYPRSGRFEDSRKMKQSESGMMWVRKEEKSGADAADVGSSGISVDQE